MPRPEYCERAACPVYQLAHFCRLNGYVIDKWRSYKGKIEARKVLYSIARKEPEKIISACSQGDPIGIL